MRKSLWISGAVVLGLAALAVAQVAPLPTATPAQITFGGAATALLDGGVTSDAINPGTNGRIVVLCEFAGAGTQVGTLTLQQSLLQADAGAWATTDDTAIAVTSGTTVTGWRTLGGALTRVVYSFTSGAGTLSGCQVEALGL